MVSSMRTRLVGSFTRVRLAAFGALLAALSATALVAAGETLKVTVNGATYVVVPDSFGHWSLDTATATPLDHRAQLRPSAARTRRRRRGLRTL